MDDLGDIPPSTSNGHSGITLVLPSLRALKAANAGKKPKPGKHATDLEQRPKVSRPIKLKPLKEVLTKLITQIKKKDDYAFFIRPVDPAQVPGYADAIKTPMDFGTMAVKVAKGRYRSLDEFSNDFRLVTTNAKTFNPLGSIYHTEADRLEAWGLDHIARAAAHVIEYETDWNIDVEQDEDAASQHVNVEDDVSTPRDFEGSLATGSRAPSTTPAPGQVQAQAPTGQGRRGPRGPYKKNQPQTTLSEGLDAEGRMPGAKDGVGAFPAGSDWAELMIALKIKGKRYKTKKERLRFEKEGPPYLPDGSLDYSEMEDPFSVLNVFVPDPPPRPQVTPLYPPSTATMITTDGSQPPSQMPEPRIHAPVPITVPSNRPPPVLSTLSNNLTQPPATAATITTTAPPPRPPKKRRHWTIVRNVPARSRAKDKDADATVNEAKTSWKVPREAGPADYGTLAAFLGELAASAVGPNVGAPTSAATAEYVYGSERRLFATIRSTVAHRGMKRKREVEEGEEGEEGSKNAFWMDERAEEAWDYLRDVVYGGVDGYAYVRSLAEFVAPSVYLAELTKTGTGTGIGDEDEDELAYEPPERGDDAARPFGVPVARYVEDNLVDTVTRGRHGWLRDVLFSTAGSASPFDVRVAALPDAAALNKGNEEQLDVASLIRVPEELAREGVLEGGPCEGGEREAIARALAWSVGVLEELGRRITGTGAGVGDGEKPDAAVKEEAMEDARVGEEEEEEEEEGNAMDVDAKSEEGKPELDARTEEDALVRRLRLNLLALAKRAPLGKIAKVPVELVPEDIRGIVPTE